jgi:type IV secretory pathway TraG/TraD family ATPase VirD4
VGAAIAYETITPKTLYLGNIERGVLVVGSAGSGKTRSAIDPMIGNFLHQGFPIMLYDAKYPEQSSRFAALAAKLGYEIHIFAPGFSESGVCNILDFLTDCEDKPAAEEIAAVFKANLTAVGQQKNDDPFWGPSGNQALAALFMLAKSTSKPDLLTALSFSERKDLIDALIANKDSDRPINSWVHSAFSQLIVSGISPKTAASIMTTAMLNLSKTIQKHYLPAIIGKTTLPINIKGKKLLIFGLERENRSSAGPIIASTIDRLIRRNTRKKRKEPLILAMDEFPSIYLPNAYQYPAENREQGLCCIWGIQNFGQLQHTYGQPLANSIFANLSTKIIFNPGEEETAKKIEDMVGEKEVIYTQRNKSYTGGRCTTNKSEQRQVRPLLPRSQLLKFSTGRAVILSPTISRKKETFIPLEWTFPLPEDCSWSVSLFGKIRERLSQQTPKLIFSETTLTKRREFTETVLPVVKTSNDPFSGISLR